MISIISELVGLVEEGKVSTSLSEVGRTLSARELRIVAIKLLGWLKARARTKGECPLELCSDYPWCLNLETLLANAPELSRTFQIKDNKLDFSEVISDRERAEIESFVNDHFKPKLMR